MKLRRSSILFFVGVAASACTAPGDEHSSLEPELRGTSSHIDAGDGDAEPTCSGVVELGRCEIAGSDADCSSVAEDQVFVPLGDGEPMTMVLGPQGSMMFVFAARTTGIDPSAPMVEINVRDATNDTVARYRAHVDLVPDPNEPALLAVAGLFVVMDQKPQDLAGQTLTAEIEIEDRKGVLRCGSTRFIAAY